MLVRTGQTGIGDSFLWALPAPGGTCIPLFTHTGLIFPLFCLIPDNQGGQKKTLVMETSPMSWWQPNPFCQIPPCPIWVPWSPRATSSRGWAGISQQEFWGGTQAHVEVLRAWGSSAGYWTVLELELVHTHRCHLICPLPMTRLEALHRFHIIYHPDHITNPKRVELQEKESHELLGDEATHTETKN